MRTEKEIKDKLYYARCKVYQNGWDVNIWIKVKEILDWVLNDQDEQKTTN